MEAKNHRRRSSNVRKKDDKVRFSRVTAVATRWTLDFLFVSLCRYFREDKMDEFNETLSVFEAISLSPSLKEAIDDEKRMICAFLARVMHGEQLDVQYDEDERVMPLMSAANIWTDLEVTVADKSLFQNITVLLLVQSVAVCLGKGQRSSASSALKWFEENHEFPQNLSVKLSTIVAERETYHPFLMSFSFSRLRETIQTYLDDYLEKNPSNYLLKAATEVARSQQKTEEVEDEGSQQSSLSETCHDSPEDTKKNKENVPVRTKRKLQSTKLTDVWKPDSCKKAVVSLKRLPDHVTVLSGDPRSLVSGVAVVTTVVETKHSAKLLPVKATCVWKPDACKKAVVSVKRISENELSQITSRSPVNTTKIQKTRKAPQKWTSELDKYLKEGVRRHGVGKWSLILLDFDFEGRTGTMLKDRWRILKKAHKVN